LIVATCNTQLSLLIFETYSGQASLLKLFQTQLYRQA